MQASDGVNGIRCGASILGDPAQAAAEIRRQIDGGPPGLVVAFASNRYDRAALATSLAGAFDDLPVVGCTTAGEIGPLGFTEGGLTAIRLDEPGVIAEIGLIENVSEQDFRATQAFAYGLRQRLAQRVANFDPSRCFALLLVDGLCAHEENVARSMHDGLGGIALVGGSAGDGLEFRETAVLHGGRFHTDAAVLVVACSRLPFAVFKTQHFVGGSRRMVVTAARPERRIVTEINGFPAAEEYARAVGVDPRELGPMVFSAHPVVVKVGGADFVRSIQKVNPDGSMTFFCAIDEGLVFNVADNVDIVANLTATLDELVGRIGPPRLMIACDCILRRLELEQKGLLGEVGAIMRAHNAIGFSTYGEQFRGIHVNQTLTGIAFGGGAP